MAVRGVSLAMIVAGLLASSAGAAVPCTELTSVSIEHLAVTSATAVPAVDRPAYCRVIAVATPVPDSVIHIEIWLPDAKSWNGKLLGTGNGGYSSALSYPQMEAALRRGYATAGSDTGHTGADLSFGDGHPEKIGVPENNRNPCSVAFRWPRLGCRQNVATQVTAASGLRQIRWRATWFSTDIVRLMRGPETERVS